MAWRTAPLLGVLLGLAACGGGGGGGSSPPPPPAYSISVSPQAVSLHAIEGGASPQQSVTVTFVGAGVVVGTLPGQTAPSWLAVNAPSQATSPLTVTVGATTLAIPGTYTTTLRFTTGSASGSNVVYTDVPVTLTIVAGAEIFVDPFGVAYNGSLAVSLNNGSPQAVLNEQVNGVGLLALGTNYTLSVPAEPSGQTCTFPNGSSTIAGVLSTRLDLALNCNASMIPWTWVGGSQTVNDAVVYGTRLSAAAGNTPGGRVPAGYAHDATGNLWVFGGAMPQGAGDRNDLWRYNIATGLWTWVSGSTGIGALGVYGTLGQASGSNVPGARDSAVAWFDANGNFWLFGGNGFGASADGMGWLNDLWMYNVAADTWTWMGGANDINNATVGVYGTTPSVSNIPGGRVQATVAIGASGEVWIFGGYGLGSTIAGGLLNDLWKFVPATGVWSWMSGSNQPGAPAVTGTQGVAAAQNNPGSRYTAISWVDGAGNFWIFGGSTAQDGSGLFNGNDLWRFDTSGLWTWMNGTSPTADLVAVGNYQAPGTTGDMPAGRGSAAVWLDASGNVWLFGGSAITEQHEGAGPVNDLWKYTPATNTWLWMSGSDAGGTPAVFGTQGVASTTNVPSARNPGGAWADPSGRLWIWGGYTGGGELNDVWSVVPQ